jgi:galactose mutarotase-like enzyme
MLCASLRYRGEEYVAWPRTLTAFKAGAATAVPLVHPWANRLGRWSYRAGGRRVDLRGLDLPVDSNGIPMHGNLLGVPFEVVRATGDRVVAHLDYGAYPDKLRAFPYPHRLTVDARLHPEHGLAITTVVEPRSDRPVPISFGWHPYVKLPSGPRAAWRLRWPACEHVEVDTRTIPTGRRVALAAQNDPIGDRTFDDHYALGRNRTLAIADDRRWLTFHFDAAYPYAQLFVPPRRRLVAIEPMTAEIDALGRGTAPVCEPGDHFRSRFTMSVTAR